MNRLLERRFSTGAVEINFAEGPDNGPPFVLLHGGAGRWQGGEALLHLLTVDWRVYAPDLRGHGRSGRVAGRYALADYASDALVFLRQVVGEPAVLYGHSLGGEIAVMAAAGDSSLVRGLIVGDAPLSMVDHPTEVPTHQSMNRLWHRLAGQATEVILRALQDMPVNVPGQPEPVPARIAFGGESSWFEYQATSLHQLDPGVLAAVLEGPAVMLAGYDPEQLLPDIPCPTLLLQADPNRGGMLRDDEVIRGLSLLPRGSHVRLSGVGHELHGPVQQALSVLESMTPFLTAVARSGGEAQP
jgi:pimeloyl-ACP methyl ester carboxylesterase